MERHSCWLLCLIWLHLYFTIHSQTSDTCVFGTNTDCFYQCKCQFLSCRIEDPDCKVCNASTGSCFNQPSVCKWDALTNEIYETNYWTGAACQKGNIAAGKLYGVSGSIINLVPEVGAVTDETLTLHVAFAVSRDKHVATVYLEETYKIEFIDFILTADEDVSVPELSQHFSMELIMTNGSSSQCSYVQFPPTAHRASLDGNMENMHYECSPPSMGYKLEFVVQSTDGRLYPLTLYEIIIIGHRFADVNFDNCLQVEGDSEIMWCSQCNNSLPPECIQECSAQHSGVNCQDTVLLTETSTLTTTSISEEDLKTTPSSMTTTEDAQHVTTMLAPTTTPKPDVIFMVIGIIVGLLLCVCVVLVVMLLFYRYRKKKKKSERDLQLEDNDQPYYGIDEETYDELDEVAVVSDDYLSTKSAEDNKVLADGYLTTKSAESITSLEGDISAFQKPMVPPRSEGNLKPKAEMNIYLSPRDVSNSGVFSDTDAGAPENNRVSQDQYLSIQSVESNTNSEQSPIASQNTNMNTQPVETERSSKSRNSYLSPMDISKIEVCQSPQQNDKTAQVATKQGQIDSVDKSNDSKLLSDSYLSAMDVTRSGENGQPNHNGTSEHVVTSMPDVSQSLRDSYLSPKDVSKSWELEHPNENRNINADAKFTDNMSDTYLSQQQSQALKDADNDVSIENSMTDDSKSLRTSYLSPKDISKTGGYENPIYSSKADDKLKDNDTSDTYLTQQQSRALADADNDVSHANSMTDNSKSLGTSYLTPQDISKTGKFESPVESSNSKVDDKSRDTMSDTYVTQQQSQVLEDVDNTAYLSPKDVSKTGEFESPVESSNSKADAKFKDNRMSETYLTQQQFKISDNAEELQPSVLTGGGYLQDVDIDPYLRPSKEESKKPQGISPNSGENTAGHMLTEDTSGGLNEEDDSDPYLRPALNKK